MKDALVFLMSYPFWVRVVIIVLLSVCLLILVVFKPNLPKDSAVAPRPRVVANVGVNNGGNVASRDIVINTVPAGVQTLNNNRIITLKQKSKIVDVLLTNRGSISIVYVRGDRKAEEYAEEIRDIFNTAYWHTSIAGANFAGFDRGLIVSSKESSEGINVIITAFDAGDIIIKPWINPHMKEKELELKVGSP